MFCRIQSQCLGYLGTYQKQGGAAIIGPNSILFYDIYVEASSVKKFWMKQHGSLPFGWVAYYADYFTTMSQLCIES